MVVREVLMVVRDRCLGLEMQMTLTIISDLSPAYREALTMTDPGLTWRQFFWTTYEFSGYIPCSSP